jgi:DNA-binding LytR/AlgR family response regulator
MLFFTVSSRIFMHADFFLNTRTGMIKCNNREIYYIQSDGKHSKNVTSKGIFFVQYPIGKLETHCLPAEMFCRVDRSFIVSLEHVGSFTWEGGIMVNGMTIPIARAYKAKLLSSLKVIW